MITRTNRTAPLCGALALLAQIFILQACGGSNSPSTTGAGGSSATTGAGGAGATTGAGGTSATTGAGGTSAGTGTGGSSATTGAGGSSATTGAGGSTGAGGTSGTAFGTPACGNTAAGTSIAKNVACTAADPQLCYKTCGPEKTGAKSETCSGGLYAEGNCLFDTTKNFMCYAVPATQPAACPATAPMASAACSVADCVVCGGTTGYLDSTGAAKTGFCVCQASATTPTWSCASSTAWPCPGNTGC